MITQHLFVVLILVGAATSATVLATLLFVPRLTSLWRRTTPLGRFAFVFAALCATLYGGTKTNQVLRCPPSPRLSAPSPRPPVASGAGASGWQLWEVRTNAACRYAMPEGATLATNWWLRGAYEDVTSINGLWAYAWGKIRFALNAPSNEIVAVGAPLSAIPLRSRLWSATSTNGALLVTWEDFAPGRIPAADCQPPVTNLQLVSVQLEFGGDGGYIVRSNDVESVYRDTRFGPCQSLPTDANERAYYTVSVRTAEDALITFIGDGPSDLADPSFEMRGGMTYGVKLLIGKTYAVSCTKPVAVVGKSDPQVSVTASGPQSFSVVWPVSITEEPPLRSAPPPGLFGAPRPPSDSFTLVVRPSWLDGIFDWSTNACCSVVSNETGWTFACGANCSCGGCEIGGRYSYEGYSILFDGIRCNCRYEPDPATHFGLTAPPVVFKDGALRPLRVSFHHGDADKRENGTLTLDITRGGDRIRLWTDADKSCEATQTSWDVSSFSGSTFYLEGVATSVRTDDIAFRLTWTRPGGSTDQRTATTTCAEVLRTEVTAAPSGIVDGSPNRQPFAGHTSWDFDVTHSPSPDKHFSVLYCDVANADFSVRDFSVDLELVVSPDGAPVGTASWFALAPTPSSGLVTGTGALTGELRNPKVGGVYHLGSCFDGSPTNECSIVLPLAGAEMSAILAGDLAEADGFVARSKSTFPRRWYTRALFASKWFIFDAYGYYRGRPDNGDRPTVYYYNQVNEDSGKGAVGTLLGVPIHVEKLSNLLAGYACEKLEVPGEEQGLAQWYGTDNDESAELSWTIGVRLANGGNFLREIGYLTTNAYRYASEKCRKLWPNPAPADNHRGCFGHGDFNVEFSSPGFIYSNH